MMNVAEPVVAVLANMHIYLRYFCQKREVTFLRYNDLNDYGKIMKNYACHTYDSFCPSL